MHHTVWVPTHPAWNGMSGDVCAHVKCVVQCVPWTFLSGCKRTWAQYTVTTIGRIIPMVTTTIIFSLVWVILVCATVAILSRHAANGAPIQIWLDQFSTVNCQQNRCTTIILFRKQVHTYVRVYVQHIMNSPPALTQTWWRGHCDGVGGGPGPVPLDWPLVGAQQELTLIQGPAERTTTRCSDSISEYKTVDRQAIQIGYQSL